MDITTHPLKKSPSRSGDNLGWQQNHCVPYEKGHQRRDACVLWVQQAPWSPPTGRPQIVSVRGVLWHRCLRKDNPESPVFTGFYTSPGIAVAGEKYYCQSGLA